MSAAYLMYDKEKVGNNPIVNSFYNSLKSDGIINTEMLEKRISAVRNKEFHPVFYSTFV